MPLDSDPVRLYLDEDTLSRSLVAALRSRGVDVLTAHEANMRAYPDVVHLELGLAQRQHLRATVVTCVSHVRPMPGD